MFEELENKAMELSRRLHDGQSYGDKTHWDHCQDVVNVLKDFGVSDPDVIAAAWCHDVIEDTTFSYNDLKAIIGAVAADIVYDVTNELGKNRKERAEKTYPKIARNPKAIRVKLADRIANMEFSKNSGSGMFKKYQTEFKEFFAQLFKPSVMWEIADMRMWVRLKELSDVKE